MAKKKKPKPIPNPGGSRLPPIPPGRNHGDEKKYDRKRVKRIDKKDKQ